MIRDMEKFQDWARRNKEHIRAHRPTPRTYTLDEVRQGVVTTADVNPLPIEPGVFFTCPEYGCGTELHRSIARTFARWLPKWFDESDGCGCRKFACKMDFWGPELCRQNIDEIVDKLQYETIRRRIPLAKYGRKFIAVFVHKCIDRAESNEINGTLPVMHGRELYKRLRWTHNSELISEMDMLPIKSTRKQKNQIVSALWREAQEKSIEITQESIAAAVEEVLCLSDMR